MQYRCVAPGCGKLLRDDREYDLIQPGIYPKGRKPMFCDSICRYKTHKLGVLIMQRHPNVLEWALSQIQYRADDEFYRKMRIGLVEMVEWSQGSDEAFDHNITRGI